MHDVQPKTGPKKIPHIKEKVMVSEYCTSKIRISKSVFATTERAVNIAINAIFFASVRPFKNFEDSNIFITKNLVVKFTRGPFFAVSK